jgi:hypothetical protein
MQTVSTQFTQHAEGAVRPLSWALRMSFDKAFLDTIGFFTLDTSALDDGDLLAPSEDNPIQQWDYYQYLNYTDRIQMLEWVRELDFPDSVTSAMADFVLENHDDYFTPDSGSPIDQYILPKRPVRLLSGFNGDNIPQFVGLTEKMPVVDDTNKVATFHAIDFLSKIYEMPLNETIAMRDVRTGEVLAALFDQLGLNDTQYDIPLGMNRIKFVFYETGVLAGKVIRELMQAEMGNLWLDEPGIIRMSPRFELEQTAVMTFDDGNVISVATSDEDDIINTVQIVADLREVQAFQTLFLKAQSSENFVIRAGESRVFSADLTDPAISAVDPTLGFATGVSWFTAILPTGIEVETDVSVVASELKTNSFDITFQNDNAVDISIDEMEIWGEPAKVYDRIEYTEVNQDSIDKFEQKVLSIENPFIQSIDQCDALALTILDGFAEYASRIEMEVKGTPALQLGDIVHVDYNQYVGDYRVIKTFNRIQSGKYTQVITARKYTVRDWFWLDISVLDGTDVLTP